MDFVGGIREGSHHALGHEPLRHVAAGLEYAPSPRPGCMTCLSTKMYWLVAPVARMPLMQAWLSCSTRELERLVMELVVAVEDDVSRYSGTEMQGSSRMFRSRMCV